ITISVGSYSVMPRMARVDRLAAVCMGRPMPCFDPAPTISTGVRLAAASVSTRANSRSSIGLMLVIIWSASSCRRVVRRLAAVQRKYLRGIEQPLGIEHRLDAHLQSEIGGVELHAHQVALLDADAVLTGEAATGGHTKLQDLRTRLLRPLGLGLVVGV